MSDREPPVAAFQSPQSQRIDKWLWCARFFKSRTQAARLCAAERIRVSGQIVRKPYQSLKPGDVLTFPLGPHIRVVRVLRLAKRRGPASEAHGLYEDLAPPPRVKSCVTKSPLADKSTTNQNGNGGNEK